MEYSKKVLLKNNIECVIKTASGDDAQAVYDSFNLTHAQTDWLLSYPDENSFSVEQERKFLEGKQQSETEVELIAIADGKIVGTAGIEAVGSKYKVRHRAEFGISIEKDYWGMGIGRALTVACIECAQAAGYTQLELDVVKDNHKAMRLYESCGFVEYGCNPKGFNSRTSGYQELVLMRKELC